MASGIGLKPQFSAVAFHIGSHEVPLDSYFCYCFYRFRLKGCSPFQDLRTSRFRWNKSQCSSASVQILLSTIFEGLPRNHRGPASTCAEGWEPLQTVPHCSRIPAPGIQWPYGYQHLFGRIVHAQRTTLGRPLFWPSYLHCSKNVASHGSGVWGIQNSSCETCLSSFASVRFILRSSYVARSRSTDRYTHRCVLPHYIRS